MSAGPRLAAKARTRPDQLLVSHLDSYELGRGGMLREFNQMAQALERREIFTRELRAPYRDYLRKNLKSARCADGAISDERSLSYSKNPMPFSLMTTR